MRHAVAVAALFALAATACDGTTGTYAVSLVTAPGSHVLDGAVRARLVLTAPHTVVEADRGADGSFALDLDVSASGGTGVLFFEGLDAAGQVIAWGRTPILPIAAISADLRIYVGAPMTFAAAPVTLDPPRAELAAAPLSYGVLLAGGVDAAGAARADLVIYDTYDHQLQRGLDLPAPRTRLTAVAGSTGFAYLFGGADAAGTATASFWRFDTTVAPAGLFLDLSTASSPALARAGAGGVAIGGEQFVVTGTPPALIDGVGARVVSLSVPPSLGGVAATTVTSGAGRLAVFVGDGAGDSGAGLFTAVGWSALTAAPPDALRTGHGVAALADGTVVAIGGAVAGTLVDSAIRVDPSAATVVSTAAALTTPRKDAAIAATGAYLVVAGGTDGAGTVRGDAEILDTTTLHNVATLPLGVARTGAIATTLPNGQILLVGGRDAGGAPIGAIELFTPPAPAGS